jgi:hypothetical protein
VKILPFPQDKNLDYHLQPHRRSLMDIKTESSSAISILTARPRSKLERVDEGRAPDRLRAHAQASDDQFMRRILSR